RIRQMHRREYDRSAEGAQSSPSKSDLKPAVYKTLHGILLKERPKRYSQYLQKELAPNIQSPQPKPDSYKNQRNRSDGKRQLRKGAPKVLHGQPEIFKRFAVSQMGHNRQPEYPSQNRDRAVVTQRLNY